MAAEYELTLNDYLSILKRRWLHILTTFLLVLLSAIAIAILLPPVYESRGTILVESQQISNDVIKSNETSVADERIQIIKQRVMTRENLFRIAEKFNLMADKNQYKSTSEFIEEEMREKILVELVSGAGGNPWEKKATIAFTISYENRNPDLAHKVANELVTLFLDENVKARTEKATETTEFLGDEVTRLKLDLEGVETKVAAFKQQHADSLPEHMDMHMNMMERIGADVKEVDRDYKATQEELRYLDVELASAKSGINKKRETVGGVPTAETELEKTKLELDRALAIYSEDHPTVKALKRKVDKLELTAKNAPKKEANSSQDQRADLETDLLVAKVQAQIDSAKIRLVSLDEQRKSLRNRLDQLQSQVSKSPEVERGLFTLMRDYENAKSKYEEVKSKHLNAKISENLEQENKAERFTLLEPPLYPEKPIKPNRKKVIALGLFGAIASALGAVFFLESLNARVRGSDALQAITKVRPMSVIPYIYTQSDLRRRKHFYRYLIIGVLGFILLSLLIVHFLILPLDIVLIKIITRFA